MRENKYKRAECPHCGERYFLDLTGIAMGCDSCYYVERDDDGRATAFLDVPRLQKNLGDRIDVSVVRDVDGEMRLKFSVENGVKESEVAMYVNYIEAKLQETAIEIKEWIHVWD